MKLSIIINRIKYKLYTLIIDSTLFITSILCKHCGEPGSRRCSITSSFVLFLHRKVGNVIGWRFEIAQRMQSPKEDDGIHWGVDL